MIDRRSFLQLALAAQAFAAFPARASTPGLRMGEPQPFSHDWLKSHAQALAGRAYIPPPRPDPKIVSSIDYDAHGQNSLPYRTMRFLAMARRAHIRSPSSMWASISRRPCACTPSSRAGARTLPAKSSTIRAISLFRPEISRRQLPVNPSPMAGFWVREPKDRH